MANQYGLGRGLSSLIPQKNSQADKESREPKNTANYSSAEDAENNNQTAGGNNSQEAEIFKIIPNPHQPRLRFNEEKIQELASSIKEHGIIQPLIVTKNNGGYEIIAGERRLQAAKLAGLKTVPIIIRQATEQQKLELAIVENIHRHDLNPIEEARAYIKLTEEFDLNQEVIAQKVGKSRSAIANKERLLKLPVEIQKALIENKITEGHAKAILAIENPEKQRALFEMIIKNSLTVRQTEDKTKEISVKSHKRIVNIDPEIKELENKLTGIFGTKVKVTKSGGGGKIIVDYYSKEELDNILSKVRI